MRIVFVLRIVNEKIFYLVYSLFYYSLLEVNMNISYENAIEKLKSEEMFHIKPGLERISAILEKLGNPQDKLKYIHVAGTNGKGSVCAIIESILREAGIKTGLYTSPHIFDYTERIKISGEDISKSDFVRLFEKAYNVSKKSDISITEFEILTVIMFLYFAENKVEVAILETGMGGRFDATNVIKENLCSVITQIDLDHTDRLGKTKNKIRIQERKKGLFRAQGRSDPRRENGRRTFIA